MNHCLTASFFLWCTLLWCGGIFSQTPFQSTGQTFLVFEGTNEVVELINDASSPSLTFNTISPGLPEAVNALAFRSTDRLLYAITLDGNELVRIDATGNMENLGPLPLSPSLDYVAGDISPDGSTFLVVGMNPSTGQSQEFAQIDLNDPAFDTETTLFGAAIELLDVAFDPTSSLVYGFDRMNKTAVNFSTTNFNISGMTQFQSLNDGVGVFVDAFGDLFAYGTTAFGSVDALFKLDELGEESVVASGSLHSVADVAHCHSSVEVNFVAEPVSVFPCSEIEFIYTIANHTGTAITGLDLVHDLPAGFTFLDVATSQVGGNAITTNPNQVRVEGLTAGIGLRELVVLVEVGDVPDDIYPSQAALSNLSPELGSQVPSDNPATHNWEDPTHVSVNVFDVDSVYFNSFFCIDDAPLTLVADQFGNEIEWFNGSTGSTFDVFNTGIYTLEASSGCQTVAITYEVTAASCPYTIELFSQPIPNQTFPCTEIIWRYYIENDSGEERENFSFIDTLPDGFQYLEILKNGFGGEVVTDFPSQGVYIENMDMALGFDTLEFLVHIGDIPPNQYPTKAIISGLPSAIGVIRESDDPNTLLIDSTIITILGTLDDSIRIDTHICPRTEVLLNAASLGETYLWENGSTDSLFLATEPGIVELTVFDGCDPSYIEYHIAAAPDITAHIDPSDTTLFLGEKIELNAHISNADDSLYFIWLDPMDTTLSCLDCTDPVAFPLRSNVYSLLLNNEFCQDSIVARINIDNTRRIYAPNIFSPNGDGINDRFFLQSPDFADIIVLEIFDRWGSKVFESFDHEMNHELTGWDGFHKGEKANLDTYMWRAEIRFLDNLVEEFYGPIIIMR